RGLAARQVLRLARECDRSWSAPGSAAKRRRLVGLRGLLGPLECLAAVNAGRVSSRGGTWFAFDAQPCADRVRGEGVGAELLAFGPGGGIGELLEPSGGDEVVALLEQ